MPIIVHIHNPGPPPTATPEYDGGPFSLGYGLSTLPLKELVWQQDPAYSLSYTLGQIPVQKGVISGDATVHSLNYTLTGSI